MVAKTVMSTVVMERGSMMQTVRREHCAILFE
jgi:hypothetical protein